MMVKKNILAILSEDEREKNYLNKEKNYLPWERVNNRAAVIKIFPLKILITFIGRRNNEIERKK